MFLQHKCWYLLWLGNYTVVCLTRLHVTHPIIIYSENRQPLCENSFHLTAAPLFLVWYAAQYK